MSGIQHVVKQHTDYNTHFSNYLTAAASEIERELERTLAGWGDEVAVSNPTLLPLFEAFSQSCKGGKRLRGTLVRLGYELAGGDRPGAILAPSVAFEIFQTAILAHDDIIDKSPLRRGQPSLFQGLGGDHYATSQAISLGNFGFFKSLELLLQSDFPNELKNKAAVFFSQKVLKTIEGEILDVYLPTTSSYTEEDILRLASLKTASYTFSGPLGLGALLGGANQKFLSQLEKLGINLGIAYQLHDDYLGVFADEKTLGKSTSSDIAEGKVTLLYTYALAHAADVEKEILRRLYGKNDLTSQEAEAVRELFVSTGAVSALRKKTNTYIDQAREVIDTLTDNSLQAQLLWSMTSYLLEREK